MAAPAQRPNDSLGQVSSETLRAQYEAGGFVGPLPVFTAAELAHLNVPSLVERLRKNVPPGTAWSRNRHLDVPEIANLCRRAPIVSAVQAILGPDIVAWRSTLWAKSSRSLGFPWHRDDYPNRVDCGASGLHCSVQINFTKSTRVNCVSALSGSHLWSDAELYGRGYRKMSGFVFPEEWIVPPGVASAPIPLEAGEFFIFHPRLLHASVRARAVRSWISSHPEAIRMAQRLRQAVGMLSPDGTIRYSLSLRVATPQAKILPAAFRESPGREAVVLLSGSNEGGVNELGDWATQPGHF